MTIPLNNPTEQVGLDTIEHITRRPARYHQSNAYIRFSYGADEMEAPRTAVIDLGRRVKELAGRTAALRQTWDEWLTQARAYEPPPQPKPKRSDAWAPVDEAGQPKKCFGWQHPWESVADANQRMAAQKASYPDRLALYRAAVAEDQRAYAAWAERRYGPA